MFRKNVTYNFVQKNKNKLKQHSATNCIAESAVSSMKQQLNLHQKLPFNDNNNLMLLNRNKIQQHLSDVDDDEFSSNLAKTSFNTDSLRKRGKKAKRKREEQEINLFKSAAKDSKQIDIKNITKQKNNEHKLEKLKYVKFYQSQQEFKHYLNKCVECINIISNTLCINDIPLNTDNRNDGDLS